MDQLANELHALLKEAQIPGPYVLVGHSLGGLIIHVMKGLFLMKSLEWFWSTHRMNMYLKQVFSQVRSMIN